RAHAHARSESPIVAIGGDILPIAVEHPGGVTAAHPRFGSDALSDRGVETVRADDDACVDLRGHAVFDRHDPSHTSSLVSHDVIDAHAVADLGAAGDSSVDQRPIE